MRPTRPSVFSLKRALSTGAPVGLVVLALPLRGRQAVQQHVLRSRRLLSRALLRVGSAAWSPRVRLVTWDKRLTLEGARRERLQNDQWEAVDGLFGSRVCPSTHAAVALQDLLDAEMGGWPNTFG